MKKIKDLIEYDRVNPAIAKEILNQYNNIYHKELSGASKDLYEYLRFIVHYIDVSILFSQYIVI